MTCNGYYNTLLLHRSVTCFVFLVFCRIYKLHPTPTWTPLKVTLCSSAVKLVVVKTTLLSFPLSVTATCISLSLDSTLQRSKVSRLEVPFRRRVAMNT